MISRRVFVGSSVALLAAPLAAEAQQTGRVPRVGHLSALSGSDAQVQRNLDAFRQGLRDLGYLEGQSIVIEYRWAQGKVEQLRDLAADLVRLKVDVIVASGGCRWPRLPNRRPR